MRDVALEIPLRLLSRRGRTERDHSADARIRTTRNPIDHTAFARGVASFEQHYDTQSLHADPLLQLHEFFLQALEFSLVALLRKLVGLERGCRLRSSPQSRWRLRGDCLGHA